MSQVFYAFRYRNANKSGVAEAVTARDKTYTAPT